MPELPEVETVRRGLRPFMEGAQLTKVELRRPDLRFPLPKNFSKRLQGATITTLSRRGKYLLAELDSSETLIAHLGMSGRFTINSHRKASPGVFVYAQAGDRRHDHIVFHLDGASPSRVIYNDPRRFGFMDLTRSDGLERSRHFEGMGPEPLCNEFTDAGFDAAIRNRKAPIKNLLLDQSIVAGVGNIYACEALYRAGISPRRMGASVAGARAARLRATLVTVLDEAIEAGGSSLRDFAGADGALGYFQHAFLVYGRENEPCGQCGAPIQRIIQSGRSTFFCGQCQR